jgi:hypothetical protein
MPKLHRRRAIVILAYCQFARGPTAPAGKESNWIPTKSGGAFEVLFRFYGPEKPLFDKTWKLGDIEELK